MKMVLSGGIGGREWGVGVMECWSIERAEIATITPSLHHSVTPSLHHSHTPTLHHSITPSLHHSITPSLHHSITPTLHRSDSTTPVRMSAAASHLSPEAKASLPRHIAIIMDGNGRWARQRHLPRIEGH